MFYQSDDHDTAMTPHNIAVQLGITAFAATPVFAEAAAEARPNYNYSVIVTVVLFVVGQGLNFGYKEWCRYRDRRDGIHKSE